MILSAGSRDCLHRSYRGEVHLTDNYLVRRRANPYGLNASIEIRSPRISAAQMPQYSICLIYEREFDIIFSRNFERGKTTMTGGFSMTTSSVKNSLVKLRVLWLLIGTIAVLLPAIHPSPAKAQNDSEVLLPSIYVVGSRREIRSAVDTPAPVDIISGEEITDQATGDVTSAIRNVVPSYNVSRQPLSDAATFIRPANLRGLASDQSLVFVNGKRRHRGAVITFLGNGVSDASQGPDISVIPAIALKRVEVLRDSASAQYGSDAIAGVINFVLKDSPEDGTAEAQWGQTYEGDGDELRLATNLGLPITENGFLNLSAEWRDTEPTSRSVQRSDAAELIQGGNTHVRQPYAQRWGAPDIDDDIKTFLNFGIDVGEQSHLYSFANFSRKESEGEFFFRSPLERTGRIGVFFLENPDGSKTPLRSRDGFSFADENCSPSGKNCFPGGFNPRFGGKITDKSATVGIRGDFLSSAKYDLSYTLGRSEADFSIRNTLNPSLGADSPTQFELGSYVQTEQTANLDLSYPVEISGFASPLFFAVGAEWRNEKFRIKPGEESSYKEGPLAQEGFGIGANGFSGFSPDISGSWDRSNIAGYMDLEADLIPQLTIGLMGRLEKFDDFGSTADGKVSSLYRITDNLSLRGSVSTGFRVPTVGQENVTNITTAYIDGALTQQGIIPSFCSEAKHIGAKELEPEESLTLAGGVVTEAGPLSLTADYFNIKVEGRIGASKDYEIDITQIADPCITAEDVRKIRFFGNGFDTRTQGVDVSANLDLTDFISFIGQGRTGLVFVGNWTKTEVTSYDPDFLDDRRILQLEDALPNYRFNTSLNHKRDKWRGLVRLNYYGPYTEIHTDNTAWIIKADSQVTFDIEATYALLSNVELTIGAENVFDNYPEENPYKENTGSKYPESAPAGFNGGFYYGRLRYFF